MDLCSAAHSRYSWSFCNERLETFSIETFFKISNFAKLCWWKECGSNRCGDLSILWSGLIYQSRIYDIKPTLTIATYRLVSYSIDSKAGDKLVNAFANVHEQRFIITWRLYWLKMLGKGPYDDIIRLPIQQIKEYVDTVIGMLLTVR